MSTKLRNTFIAVAIAAAFGLGFALRGGDSAPPTSTETTDATTIWTCSMHPQIRLPEPGQCPICGMDLIPLRETSDADEGPRTLTLSPAARALAEIQTAPVERRALQTTVRTVGKLEPDETRVREISAWVAGRIDRLYIDTTGVAVRADQELFDLYSPELYSAQEELLQAIQTSTELSRSGLESTRRSAPRTIEAARERLRLWGMNSAQIEAVEKRGTPSYHVTILSPMSGVVLHKDAVEGTYVQTGKHIYSIADLSVLWLQLDVFESDLAWVQEGQKVSFGAEAYPGESFEGRVAFIDPVVDQKSRTIKVRVEVANAASKLKPGMFAHATIHADVTGVGEEKPLVIPKSAALFTGTRAVVYVADPHEPGRFHGREVVLGPRADGFVAVRSGLSEGERVVSNGNFKIDSALQIRAKTSMMSPASDAPHAMPMQAIPMVMKARAKSLLDDYLDLSAALSEDDLQGAQDSAREIVDALQSDVEFEGAGDELLKSWEEMARSIASAAGITARSQTLAETREGFYELSNAIIRFVRMIPVESELPVFLYHCPMAMDGEGADWMQSAEKTRNPYYGSAMLSCGSRTETLVPGHVH